MAACHPSLTTVTTWSFGPESLGGNGGTDTQPASETTQKSQARPMVTPPMAGN